MTDGTGPVHVELHRMVKIDRIDDTELEITATADERAALAERFGIPAIHSLAAKLSLEAEGAEISASGGLLAEIDQLCAVSGEPFRNTISEPLAMRFVPQRPAAPVEPDEEIELTAEELDEIEYDGKSFDLGEAVAQSFGLAIDPYAEGPNSYSARQEAGIVSDEEATGPLADLLRDAMAKK